MKRLVVVGLLGLLGCQAPAVRAPDSEPSPPPPVALDAAPVNPARVDSGSVIMLPEAGPQTAVDAASSAECGRLTAVVRDFRSNHPDFENQSLNVARLFTGLVLPELDGEGKPVYAHPGPTATTSGPTAFRQWYRDVPGINLRFEVPLQLVPQGAGLHVYDNQQFFPIDKQGWPADERLGHNFHFTTELHTTFRYKTGQRFTFTGDDDVFVFINRRLALDLGGLHPTLSQTVDLDAQAAALGLTVGGLYALDVFHAERFTVRSTFRIETSIDCLQPPVE